MPQLLIGSDEAWRASAIDGMLAQSDWNVCERCMTRLRPFLGASEALAGVDGKASRGSCWVLQHGVWLSGEAGALSSGHQIT